MFSNGNNKVNTHARTHERTCTRTKATTTHRPKFALNLRNSTTVAKIYRLKAKTYLLKAHKIKIYIEML